MLCELEYLIKSHSDHEALDDQASLRDILTDLRHVADDLGLDFRLALTDARADAEPSPAPFAFDWCI